MNKATFSVFLDTGLSIFSVQVYSYLMHTESKNLKETLQPILGVLRDLGGKFTFMDEEGNQFVLASKEALEHHEEAREAQPQLLFPEAATVARTIRKHVDSSLPDDVIDRINRDLALAAASEQEDEEDEIEELIDQEEKQSSYTAPKPPKIRFESIKGDLAPELQE
jgi:hypothetical protein